MTADIATPRTHREAAGEAGLGHVSLISLLAGLVTAYGTFALVAAVAGSLLAAGDVSTDFRTNDWTGSGAIAALTSAIVLFIAYLFGGYVTGRMARRSGVVHGVLLFVATLVVGAIAGALVSVLTDDAEISSNLRTIGVPTTMDQITDVAIVGLIASLVAILLGCLAGAVLGERWHTKLAHRIADPEIGTSAEQRRRAEEAAQERRDRIRRDPSNGYDDGSTRTDDTIDLPAEERRTAASSDSEEPRYTEAEWRALGERRVR